MFVTHLESALDGTKFPPGKVYSVHQGRPLVVKYDLPAIKRAVRRETLTGRPPSLWRYRELLPLPESDTPVSFGEGMSPVLACPRLGKELGLPHLFIKDESQLPTGSFKSRGMAAAVSMAKHLGLTHLAVPSAGNAGGALAAYAARAGLKASIFMPEDTPIINQLECLLAGAKVFLVNGLISDCGKIVKEGVERVGWFSMATLQEPYRLEGKKTMGLELAEQFNWKLPDVILYPTGGGTGLIGMWKAFQELQELGWLDSPKLPKLIVCQSDGCAPIVRAYQQNERFAKPWENAVTIASGLRVPGAVADFMMLDAVRTSAGTARMGSEGSIRPWMQRVTSLEGISLCPESAVCFDVLEQLKKEGFITPQEQIVVFNTGAAQKYVETLLPGMALRLGAEVPRIDCTKPIDWQGIMGK
jgi:threonine synthase